MQDTHKSNESTRYSIGQAATLLGISIDTLRRWEKAGKVKSLRSPGGHRYFEKEDLDQVFGKRYQRYSKPKQENKPTVAVENSSPPPSQEEKVEEQPITTTESPAPTLTPEIGIEEKPVIETPIDETPIVEPLPVTVKTSPLLETPPAGIDEPSPSQPEVTTVEQKPLRSYAVVEQVGEPTPPPPVTTFEHLKENTPEATPLVSPQDPIPKTETVSSATEPVQQPSSTLAPDEPLTDPITEAPSQPEVINQNKKGSKMKPLLIFLAIFVVVDIILLIVYFVTNRSLVSPLS